MAPTTPIVLHVSSDIHDVFDVNKPLVVGRLVDGLASRARNVVVSINRTSNPFGEQLHRAGDVWSLRYFSPPHGLLLAFFLGRLTQWIVRILAEAGLRPDIMVGHKFTVESVICSRLSQQLGVPYIACFQGNTDCKIFKFKPRYRPLFSVVARNARALVFPTPWSQRFFEERLLTPIGDAAERRHLIPFISGEMGSPAKTRPTSVHRFVMICRLDAWRLKNVHRLIEAISMLRSQTDDDWTLDIVGPGTAETQRFIASLIERFKVTPSVRILGSRTREQIDALLPDYCAMVLPSHPESFGLVYLEALLQGVPIMCARGAGFDGFFEAAFPGIVVRHDSVEDIVEGLRFLSQRSDQLRQRIQDLSAEFEMFERGSIESRFSALLGI